MKSVRIGVVALAIVAAQLAVVKPAAASVLGHQIVSVATAGDSVSPKTVTAQCPSGKRVIGAGYFLDGDVEHVVTERMVPLLTTVQVTASEFGAGTKGNWWLRAFAVCVAENQPGIEVVQMASASDSSASKTMTVSCPAGKAAVGVGASIGNGGGSVGLTSVMHEGTGSVRVTANELGIGTGNTWLVRAYAICTFHITGFGGIDTLAVSPDDDKVSGAACGGPGRVALAVGWSIESRSPHVITAPIVFPQQTSASVAAQEVGPDVSLPWSLRTRVMCGFPA